MALEAMAVLLIVMLASVFAAEKVHDYMLQKEWSVMAIHATTFNEAAKSYIADNTGSLLATSTQANPVRITPSLLISNGYLQKGFSAENSYGQSYVTVVVKNDKLKGRLQALTCTVSGTAIPYRGLRSISTQIQGMGGYVNEDNVATGAYGGWTSNTRDFGISCTSGHIAIALSSEVLGTAMQESDRLYRYQVNGRPYLNRMHTAIDMNGNDINNGGTLNGKAGVLRDTLTAGSDIKSIGGWLVTGESKGWINDTYAGGFYMSDNDWIRSVNNKGIYTAGQIKGGTVRAEGRLSAGEYLQLDGVAVAGSACNGKLIGLDKSGSLLTCQNQRWQSLSGGTYSRTATGSLAMHSPGTYKNVLVTVSSLFNGEDGSHTAYADFSVTLNGHLIGTVDNQVTVYKGGSNGHSWVYQSYAVAQRMFTVPVSTGNQIGVTLASASFHVSSDIRVDLTD